MGSYAGAESNPSWVHNLRADPRVYVEVAGEAPDAVASYEAIARELPLDERNAVYTKVEQCVAGDVDGLITHLGDCTGDDVVDLDGIEMPVRSTSWRRLWASRSTGSTSCSAPFALPLPTGVRTASRSE